MLAAGGWRPERGPAEAWSTGRLVTPLRPSPVSLRVSQQTEALPTMAHLLMAVWLLSFPRTEPRSSLSSIHYRLVAPGGLQGAQRTDQWEEVGRVRGGRRGQVLLWACRAGRAHIPSCPWRGSRSLVCRDVGPCVCIARITLSNCPGDRSLCARKAGASQ